jgi:hypothetical protein
MPGTTNRPAAKKWRMDCVEHGNKSGIATRRLREREREKEAYAHGVKCRTGAPSTLGNDDATQGPFLLLFADGILLSDHPSFL